MNGGSVTHHDRARCGLAVDGLGIGYAPGAVRVNLRRPYAFHVLGNYGAAEA